MNGVLFGDKHSFKDWGLILKERPDIKPPNVKTSYVDIAGANGSLDLTEVLSDDVKLSSDVLRSLIFADINFNNDIGDFCCFGSG